VSPSNASTITPAALAPPDAARYIGVAPLTLKKWRGRGVGPTYCKAQRRVVYRVKDLDTWLAKNAVGGDN
jgi:hypothetical protein